MLVKVLTQLSDVFIGVDLPLGECHFHLRKICKALPGLFARSPEGLENLKDLSDLGVTSKERLLVRKFEEDSTDRPDIDGCRVNL